MTVNDAGFADNLDQAVRQCCGTLWLILADLYDREFVPAQSGDLIAFPQILFQPKRDRFEKSVPDRVPQCVVGDLEAVEIDKQNSQGFVALTDPDQRLV